MSDKKVSYFNTLVFTIITGIVSLLLLTLFFFQIGKEYMVFLITLEAGIFAIIAVCIYRIVSFEKRKQSKADQNNYVMNFSTCPDYYVKRMVGDRTYCFNDYTSTDANGNKYIMKLYPVEVNGTPITMPATITPSNSVSPSDYLYEKFELNALEKDSTLKTFKDKCALIYETPADKVQKYSHLPSLPWTFAASRCQSFADA